MTTKVLVIGGGQNAEHEVSLASAAAVAAALRMGDHEVTTATIDRDGIWRVDGLPTGESAAESLALALPLLARTDVVFPAVHGALGEDGALAALCALAGVRVVGSGLRAGAIGMDKWTTKLVADAVGLGTARGRLVSADDIGDVEFEGEVVVKPVSAGSSHGVSLVTEEGELLTALREAARFDRRILVEEVVRGREIDVAVLREKGGIRWAAPPLEIHTTGLFDTATKYDGSARFTVPAQLDAAEVVALKRAAIAVFDALGCDGVARMDFFLTERGPVLNEVNTMPGLTAASQVPRMFAAVGVTYVDLVARLVRAAS
ncbi:MULTISPECIES: D-alanine--D-alanine ligase [unclassified Microbacterium]|uniref:D-alanine--D-alanine ligase family protein n=1 Tax=unclassified Microbacterium TaxID=2609290 RepID=UPI000CFB1314|nr:MULTISPECIES: D-alanine--D-alanine ligase [unclassified Microbacterium]PQZ55415.1 D-alanine--D-alanine ligase [Microbacterium sp. MYb43]PQZ76358.1 D-alanine--D-alanine ligase [Microbacterium sp. MYb40]PRB21196.1 D-alanine--D-alanine ligase [Microbacterium sp. MYb54]PRB26378.1 D-alanine--D-alanine ligase [Microbacterium sp. MYb50]PRB67017.1 D-alanine--D-alanine ligase [Microbacterium sp. MYb24]